jgi:hypothetical protein
MIIGVMVPVSTILLVVLLVWLFNYSQGSYYIIYILISIFSLLLIFGIAWLVYQIIRKRRYLEEQEEISESSEFRSSERNIDDFHRRLKTHRRDKALYETLREVKIIKFNDDVTGHQCSISKSKFTAGEEVLQCPYCKSLFKRNYLIDWLVKNDICPVCRYKIVVRI